MMLAVSENKREKNLRSYNLKDNSYRNSFSPLQTTRLETPGVHCSKATTFQLSLSLHIINTTVLRVMVFTPKSNFSS